MSDLSQMALANAIQLEIKKDGLQQRQSGDWTLRVTVAATDMDQRLVRAAMGARYQCVLVEIDDDETPINHEYKVKQAWRDLGPVKQSVLRCKEPRFWAFLRETKNCPGAVNDELFAANAVRNLCGIDSRSLLDKPGYGDARTEWFKLDNAYQAWLARENA